MKTPSVDMISILAGLRTSAALMIGNSIVVPILTNGKSTYWWVLLVVGIALMIATSLKQSKE